MLKTVSSITNAIGALNYKGTWNASTNTPTITSSVGVKGDYYVVAVAGSTSIDGISNWGVGDWITFNGAVWQRVEGGADLNGVNLSVSGTTTLNTLNTSGQVVFNDAGADVDFRVEGVTNANLLLVDASADSVGIGTNSLPEQFSITQNIASTSTSGSTNRGTKYLVDSSSTTALDICEFTVNYDNVAGRSVGGFIDVWLMYTTHDSNTRAATCVANLRVSVARPDRAGNTAAVAIGLELIGTPILRDTGGGTSRLIDIADFASTTTGAAGAQQTVTISFTPPSPLATASRTVAIAELVELNYITQMALVQL